MTQTTATVGTSTYLRIKRDIVFGALAPGAKLKLDALRRDYDASNSTLREALNRLASEGFVDAPEQRGFLVKPVSREDLREIAELRVLLECHALQLSIANGDTEWEAQLVAAHHKLHRLERQLLDGGSAASAVDIEDWKRYDRAFHQALIAACHSDNLLSLHATIFEKYLRYQVLVLTNRGAVAVAEHQAMLEAALARDAGRASAALEEHIVNGLDHVLGEMP